MPLRRRRRKHLYVEWTELALAAPAVMAHRLSRLAAAGDKHSLQDRREFDRMITEKAAAVGECWSEMTVKTWEVNERLALSMMRSWLRGAPSVVPHPKALQRAATDVLAAGMTPLHKRATANARRLGRRRKRS